jgi:transposase
MLAGMKAYSKDLRLKVLDALDRSMDRREVVEVFGVSLPSIKRWLKMRRESTHIEARPIAGPPAAKRAMLLEWLPSQLQCNPDLTLEEHREAFEDDLGGEGLKGHYVPHHRPPSGFLAAQRSLP